MCRTIYVKIANIHAWSRFPLVQVVFPSISRPTGLASAFWCREFDRAEWALSRARKGLSWANDSSAHGDDRRLSQPAKMATRTSYSFAGPITPDSQSYSFSANTAYYLWRHTALVKSTSVNIYNTALITGRSLRRNLVRYWSICLNWAFH